MIPLYRKACVSSRTSSHIFQLSEPVSLHSARISASGSNSSETGFLFALRSSGRRKKNPKVCPPVIFPANSISRKLPYSGVSVKTGSFHPVSDPSHSRSETYPCLPVFPVRTRQSFPEKSLVLSTEQNGISPAWNWKPSGSSVSSFTEQQVTTVLAGQISFLSMPSNFKYTDSCSSPT